MPIIGRRGGGGTCTETELNNLTLLERGRGNSCDCMHDSVGGVRPVPCVLFFYRECSYIIL